MLLDSHAHITAPQFLKEEREEILRRAAVHGVQSLLIITTNTQELEECFLLKKPNEQTLLFAAATTPHEAVFEDSLFQAVEKAAVENRIHAIGETGLDYYYEHAPRDAQKFCFERYLQLAEQTKKPLVVHCREAFSDLFALLRGRGFSTNIILHCFTGTKEEAEQLLDLGIFISFSGIVTYPKSYALQEVARSIPLQALLLETDAPYLAPQGFRGKRCEPSMITATYDFIAELRGVRRQVIEEAVMENFQNCFAN